MSAEQFSQLSLAEAMVTTRAGAAKARTTGSRLQQDSGQDQSLYSIEMPSPSPTPSLVISTNNLQYNVSAFDSDLRRRAKMGLEDKDIKMKYCALSSESDADGIKHFYIDDDITIAIGGKLQNPKCNCGANEKGVACKHIYWLTDQILSTVPEALEEQPIQISPDGSTANDVSSPESILNSKGLTSVAGDLKWVMKKEKLSDDEEEIKGEITNMLSVFEPQDALPGEFKCPESPLTSERSRKYQEFAKLFTDYAARNPGLFIQLRGVIDLSFQRRVFFEKIDTHIARTFHALDDYIAHGTMDATSNALRFDVPNCAKKLRAIVGAITQFCREQDEDHPDTKDIANRAVAALISILGRVVDRNVNAYENITWGLEAPDDATENNLFVALIGLHGHEQSFFVVDALRSLPPGDVFRNHWETLQAVEQKLIDQGAPPEYVNAFRSVVHESRKRAASETREGEAKRAMQE